MAIYASGNAASPAAVRPLPTQSLGQGADGSLSAPTDVRELARCHHHQERAASPSSEEETPDSLTGQGCDGRCLRPSPRPRALSPGCSQGRMRDRPPHGGRVRSGRPPGKGEPHPWGLPRMAARRSVTCDWFAGRLLLHRASQSQHLPVTGQPEEEEWLSRASRRPPTAGVCDMARCLRHSRAPAPATGTLCGRPRRPPDGT